MRTVWSGIDVSETEIFKEALQAQLINRIWTNAALRQELLTNPKAVYAREAGITFPASVEIRVLEEHSRLFYFIVPDQPIEASETLARLRQMSGWWMAAYTWWWMISRIGSAQADAFRESLQAMIIGHIWTNESFRQAIQLNPRAVLEAEIGIHFPSDMQVMILEERAQTKYLVLPKHPKDHELNPRCEQLGEWWMAAHTWWWWLIWLRIHAEIQPT